MGRKRPVNEDLSLQTLLDLDGEIFPMESGYWTKFEVCRVDPTPAIPHGIRYSLTLHDRSNTRILGFDNAHAFRPRKRRYGGRKIEWDHQHKRDRTYAYEFETTSNLIEDFWAAVEEIIG